MLTPAFELHQDQAFLTVIIKARYAKVSETEVFVDGTDFKFYSKPYFLRLNLPGRIIEDGREKAAYDTEKGSFTIRVPKETPGEHFEGLDLLTRLLAPRGATSAAEPHIEIIGDAGVTLPCDKEHQTGQPDLLGHSGESVVMGKEEEEEAEEEFDWQLEQHPYHGDEDDKDVGLAQEARYGFANRRSGVFKRLRDEICGVVDIQEADSVSLPERKRARLNAERDKFDDSHYLADFYQEDAILPFLQYRPSWVHNYQKMREKMTRAGDSEESGKVSADVMFSEEETELMRKLPRKEYILNNVEERGALLGVADILFAYAYNVRTNEGENSVESAWTVCKLSSTLSCLEWFHTPQEMVIACCRRALCFPLYRNWDLCCKVLKDVRMILRLGCNQVLKCFFEVHRLLSNDEPRYILNDLYIADYCVWLQSTSNDKFAALEQEMGKVQITKKDVGLDLDVLEQAASLVREEEEEEEEDTQDRMETVDPQASCSHHGHNPINQDLHPRSPEGHFHLGYPDLIQPSQPGPDIVTTHVVRSPDRTGAGASPLLGRAQDSGSDGDSRDSDDDSDEEEDVQEELGCELEDESRKYSEAEQLGKDAMVNSGVGTNMKDAASSNAIDYVNLPCSSQSLEMDFISKVTIATRDDTPDAELLKPVQTRILSASEMHEGAKSVPDAELSMQNDNRGERGTCSQPSVESSMATTQRDGETEVVETMKKMLHQLSLDHSSQQSSGHVQETGQESQPSSFSDWAEALPTETVEMFGAD
ncbi:protein SHQ1 homolog isoform X1 [Diadema setosum]|uniref:protein SHQ1 homolog isoform X1 n=1 Tax=Diadema setosum TaxID=31175 RepID=UPI003B3ADA3E